MAAIRMGGVLFSYGLPQIPIGAQMALGGRTHFLFGDAGTPEAAGHTWYLTAPLPPQPVVAEAEKAAILAAIKAAPQEPSYSGSGTPYVRLGVEPDPQDDRRAWITVGAIRLGVI